ncbi:POU domain, class 5, transcription factor 1.1-like [Rana temporaria]|uniref:POU domain, class 5, transcription factor 1.1-like n=1 Tax=Rana temporaria TaxID=8407 RepID=UPI001AAC72CC|nr:POU domain, class 5, transcription factor 1.1-like [Rana temporaria]
MYSQQAFPPFILNPAIVQYGGYHHPSQAFFSPAVITDHGALAKFLAWNHAPQLEPPSHLNFCAPPRHPLNMETPGMVESMKTERSEDGSVKERSCLIPQYYTHDWIPAFWPGSPNFPSQTQENASVPGSEGYLTPPGSEGYLTPPGSEGYLTPPGSEGYPTTPNQSPNTTVVAKLESSAPTQEVAKESNSPAGSTVTSLEAQEKILSEDSEDTLEMTSKMEMEKFARDMKQKRLAMGFTQADVCYAVGALYGKIFTQTTICKFESVQLTYKNMCRIKPFLQRWLKEAKNNDHLQEMINQQQMQALALAQSQRKKKRRTGIGHIAKVSLETYFTNNPRPFTQELAQIARDLHMEKDVVRVWFCNRRQRKKSLVVKELSNTGHEPQHIVPQVGVFSHQMPFLGYMSGSPPMYNPAFHHKNMFQQLHVPYGMQLGNQIC